MGAWDNNGVGGTVDGLVPFVVGIGVGGSVEGMAAGALVSVVVG